MSQYWWEKYPDRLEYELAALEKHQINYTRDEEAFNQGILILYLSHKVEGEDLELKVTFPDYYPYTRFEMVADDLELPKHQNPFGKNLCLIGRSTLNWDPQSDYLAKFIVEQLPKVLQAQKSQVDFEERQGEPISAFYGYSDDNVIFVDSSWSIDANVDGGKLTLGINSYDLHKLAILRVLDSSRNILSEGPDPWGQLYNIKHDADWVRIPAPVKINNSEEYYKYLLSQFSHLGQNNLSWFNVKGQKGSFAVIGVTFPEELEYGKQGDGWLFILIHKINKKSKNFSFVRAGRAGIDDLLARIPNSTYLKYKKVVVVGLGAIGAPSAIEFARNCLGELRILDHDHLEPGNIVRWPLGLSAVPYNKSKGLQSYLAYNYPYTTVKILPICLGQRTPEYHQPSLMDEFMNGVDLVYDASAEVGVHHILADICQQKNIPLVISFATHGAWGGTIARFIPEETCCWQCFQRAIFKGDLPSPPENKDETVQPVGCADPTFVGANFDLQEIALAGVRLSVATLLKDQVSDIDYNWHAANLSLIKEGKPTLPEWTPISPTSYPNCPICNQKK